MENTIQYLDNLKSKLLEGLRTNDLDFESFALNLFKFQAENNRIYHDFINYLNCDIESVKRLDQIPFLPVSTFKTNEVKTTEWKEEFVFESSTTTGMIPSKHFVRNMDFYRAVSGLNFYQFYNNVEDYCFYGLLPSYLERKTSSLVWMVENFINLSGCGKFYRYDYELLYFDIYKADSNKKKVLFGVTYALLDFAQKIEIEIDNLIIIETGGMKGFGHELPRDEVHKLLKQSFHVPAIDSEYGMTEMLSQAYSRGNGIFIPSSSMKILISDISDPFQFLPAGQSGKVNIIDLANIDTCSFICTEDIGVINMDGGFEILGRTDSSEVRGCNLLFDKVI